MRPAFAAGPGQIGGFATALGRCAHAQADFVALVALLQDHVHDAGDRVGTVDRRSAAGQHFDALDRGGGNVAVVGEVALAAVRQRIVRDAPAVDQQQAAAGTHIAQIERTGVGRVRTPLHVGFDRADRFVERGQRVVDGDEAFFFDLLGGEQGQRRRTFDLCALDARAGDGDLVELFGAGFGGGRRFLRRRRRRRGRLGQRGQRREQDG